MSVLFNFISGYVNADEIINVPMARGIKSIEIYLKITNTDEVRRSFKEIKL